MRSDMMRGFIVVGLGLWVSVQAGHRIYSFCRATLHEKAARDRASSVLRGLPDRREPVEGSRSAQFKIIEFSDYQCPYCKSVDIILKRFIADHPDSVALYRYDLPLEQIHPYALKAAIAAGCAEIEGVGSPFQALLFQHQTEFASVDWIILAHQAGITQTKSFSECVDHETPRSRIASDSKIGKTLGFLGTPSFIVNGSVFGGNLTDEVLQRLYRSQ